MEDLTEKITDMLSDPETMNTLKSISGLLGSSNNEKNYDTDEKNENPEQADKEENSGFSFSPEMMQIVLKVIPILSSIKKDDKYTKFLEALRPLLSEEKRKKLDSSSQILKIVRILPLLKNQGIL